MFEKKWNISPEEIEDKEVSDKYRIMQKDADSKMRQRTKGFELYTRISHMQNIYDHTAKDSFSEGSTQAIKRKIRSETIQRVPDGEIKTQFDKNSIEQVQIEYIFKNKVLHSEYDGKDMLKNLTRAFNASYDYGYACVRTGFEKDLDGDVRISFKHIQWADVLPAPDCDFIEEAEWYMIREYVSRTQLKELIDCDTGELKPEHSSYEEKTVKYLLENEYVDAGENRSRKMADTKKAVFKTESVETWTLYWRGMDEFVTFVPSVNAVLRRTKNYDPRGDLPLHFLILEPDPEFPLGVSSVMYTLGQQQYADAFQTVSYQTLLLAAQPPLMGFGNLTPAKIKMKPRAYWAMGTNPNNKIEKFPVETTTITQYGSILNNIAAAMNRNLNVSEATIAADANVAGYSATPQGVEQQRADKSTTVNQYQKRLEVFFSEWANHALRSYLGAMTGEQQLTVDEETRRRIHDIETSNAVPDPLTGELQYESIIDGDKITIDFSELSTDMLEFDVRTGSLIQSEKEKELENIQQMLVPISQMMGNISEQNRPVFEQSIMDLCARLFELSDIDISQTNANRISDQMMMSIMQATMQQIDAQNAQLQQQQQQINGMQQQMGISPEQNMLPEGEVPMEQPTPGMPEGMPAEGLPGPEEVSAEFPQQGEEVI